MPATIAQEQLGHASISTTGRICTHVVDASHRAAVTAVEGRLFGVMLRDAQKSGSAARNGNAGKCSQFRAGDLSPEQPLLEPHAGWPTGSV